jgi:predicted site-specific integrase-resolvase
VLKQAGRTSEVANLAEHDPEDLLHALSSIVSSLYARLYDQQRAKRTTEQILQQLEAPDARS